MYQKLSLRSSNNSVMSRKMDLKKGQKRSKQKKLTLVDVAIAAESAGIFGVSPYRSPEKASTTTF